MSGLKNNKIAILVIIAVVGLGGYFLFGRSNSSSSSETALTPSETHPETVKVLQLLQKLKVVSQKLDSSFFADPLFASLRDFTVTVPPENPGRPNPFQSNAAANPQTQTQPRTR